MHMRGFLHREIKPYNFLVGLGLGATHEYLLIKLVVTQSAHKRGSNCNTTPETVCLYLCIVASYSLTIFASAHYFFLKRSFSSLSPNKPKFLSLLIQDVLRRTNCFSRCKHSNGCSLNVYHRCSSFIKQMFGRFSCEE
jgi:hypothetical protein